MPNRILREGILTSRRIERLNWAEEVFYRRLMSVVDDFGRYYADAGLLHAACYPRQLNKVSDSDIGKWIRACVDAALVRVYPAEDGESYLQLLDFGQQVRAKKSRFPDPMSTCAADATQTPANAHLDVFVSVSESECVSPAAPPTPSKAKPRKAPMPDDFGISERVRVWAESKGFGNLGEHLDAFKRKCAANSYAYADWDAAFMEAIREDWAKLRGRAGMVQPAGGSSAPTAEATTALLAAQKAVPPPNPELARAARDALQARRLTA